MSLPAIFTLLRSRPELLAGEEFPPPPRQARSRQKREALLQAGLALFAERGYEATTVEDVAHRAEVAVGSFYQHFRSKRQLLLVLMDRLLEEVARIDFSLAWLAGTDPRAAIRRTVHTTLSLDWSYAGVHRAWGEAILQDEELAALNRAIEEWTVRLATAVFAQTQRMPGARRDVDVPTSAWIITLLFWGLAGRVTGDRAAVEGALAELVYHTFFADPPRECAP